MPVSSSDYQRFSSSGILRAADKFCSLPLPLRNTPQGSFGICIRENARAMSPTTKKRRGLAAGRRRPSPNRCYTGGCFIARFAAWPPRVTRLTEILIESETTPSQRVPHHRRTNSFLVYGSALFQPPSSCRPPLPLLDGLSESEEDRG